MKERAKKSFQDETVLKDGETMEASEKNHEADDVNSELEAVQDEMKDEAKDDIEMLKSKVAAKDKEIQEGINQLQRLQADFINFKKRVEKEKSDIYLYANEKLAAELLVIIDNLERALETPGEELKESSLYQGIQLVLKQLTETLKKHGVEEIEALHKPFDANFHHAVMQEEQGTGENLVVEVYQKGYSLQGRVLRPAMVKVSK